MGRVLQSPPFVKIRHNRTRAIKSFFSAMGVAKLFTSDRAVQCSLHIEKNRRVESAGFSSDRGVSWRTVRDWPRGYPGVVKQPFIA